MEWPATVMDLLHLQPGFGFTLATLVLYGDISPGGLHLAVCRNN